MKQAIIGIRYFECEEYARDFVEGRIFFNSAGKFENIKNQEQHYVEGRVPCYSREIVINGEKIVGDICSSDFISNQIKCIFQKPNAFILG